MLRYSIHGHTQYIPTREQTGIESRFW